MLKKRQSAANKRVLKDRRLTGFTRIKTSHKGCYLFFLKNYRIEFRYIMFLKRLLKGLRRCGIKSHKPLLYKLYISLTKNYSLTKKSKNSRMGKGKGTYIREAIKVKKFRPFIYTIGYQSSSLLKLATSFERRTNKKSSCFSYFGYVSMYS